MRLICRLQKTRGDVRHRKRDLRDDVSRRIVDEPADWTIPRLKEYQQKYCLDRAIVNAAAVQQSKSPSGYFTEQRLEYVLTTGANWSKPIGEFRLVVEKGAPDNLVSLCGSGIKKISPTQFEMRVRNFIPTENLRVLILKRELPEPSPGADRSDAIEQRPDLAAIRRGDYKCSDLWYFRNNLFKVAGYCFKTAQAIRTFGNSGCAYDSQGQCTIICPATIASPGNSSC